MRAALIVSGVLGGGVALVFAAAVLAATMFPTGATVPAAYGWPAQREFRLPGAAPAPVDGQSGAGWGAVGLPEQGVRPGGIAGQPTLLPIGNTSAP